MNTVKSLSSRAKEQGYILFMLCVLIALLISFASLAIDTGRVYQIKMRAERAARAGTVAALAYRSLVGWQAVYGGSRPVYGCSAGGQGMCTTPGSEGTTGAGGPEARAIQALRDNLKAAGLPLNKLASPSVTSEACLTQSTPGPDCFEGVDYDVVNDKITIDVVYNAPTFLVGRVPVLSTFMSCSGGTCPIKFKAEAQLRPANVSLILDYSGSMSCSRGSGATCLRTPGVQTKMQDLIEAVRSFRRMFNPKRDYLQVIPFNLVAAPASDSFPLGSNGVAVPFGATKDQWDDFVEATDTNLQNPRSNTNHCDALWEAYNRFNDYSVQGEKFYVFFTDGAPTAGRFAFADLKNPAVKKAFDDRGFPNNYDPVNDWFLYSVEWNPGATTYTGPGVLVHNTLSTNPAIDARTALYNYPIGRDSGQIFPLEEVGGTKVPKVVPCADKNYWTTTDYFSKRENFRSMLTYCLDDNFGFVMPGQQLLPRGQRNAENTNSLDLLTTETDPFPDVGGVGIAPYYQQLFYHCTLEAADIIRKNNGTIYAVGLGASVPRNAFRDNGGSAGGKGDPYWDAANQWAQKGGYGRWFTGDPDRGGDFSFGTGESGRNSSENDIAISSTFSSGGTSNETTENPHSHKGKSLRKGYRKADFLTTQNEGAYYGTNNSDDVKELFVQIAKQILLRVGS